MGKLTLAPLALDRIQYSGRPLVKHLLGMSFIVQLDKPRTSLPCRAVSQHLWHANLYGCWPFTGQAYRSRTIDWTWGWTSGDVFSRCDRIHSPQQSSLACRESRSCSTPHHKDHCNPEVEQYDRITAASSTARSDSSIRFL